MHKCELFRASILPEVDEFAKAARDAYTPGEGFFIDFWNWTPSYYVQLYSPHNAHVYMASDLEKHTGEYGRFREFFTLYPKGVISLFDYSGLSREFHYHGNLAEIDSVPGGLLLSPVYQKNHLRLFRYTYISPEETAVQRQKLNFVPPLFTFEKDLPISGIPFRWMLMTAQDCGAKVSGRMKASKKL